MSFLRTTAAATGLLALLSAAALAQGVGINATGAAADTSALLDLNSTAKGFLVPRMTAAQRSAIALPATGLLVFQTDGTAGMYYNAGTPASAVWRLLVDNATSASGPWSTSGSSIYYNGGRVGVGASAPGYRFTVMDTGLVFRVQANNMGSAMASFGGAGSIQVDAPGVVGGRLSLLDSGYLGLGRVTPSARLDVLGGNWDVVNGEGDVRLGDGTTRLKFGIALSGAGAGAATIMEQGAAGAYNVLALGTQGNKVLYVNGALQRIGIGVDQPTAPLGFSTALGKKITLYPGATGDYGFGVTNGRLQIFSESAGTDVAIGSDAGGTFVERLAVRNNGALAVNGSTGASGQVLQSTGNTSAPAWVSATNSSYNATYFSIGTSPLTFSNSGPTATVVPGLSQTFSVASSAKVIVAWSFPAQSVSCFACGSTYVGYRLNVDGADVGNYTNYVGNDETESISSTRMVTVGAGTHAIQVVIASTYGNSMVIGGFAAAWPCTLTLQVIPQ